MRQHLRNEVQRIKVTLLSNHDNKCYVCHYDCIHILVVHHIKPLSEGGTNELSNLVVLCPNCHALVHKLLEFSGKAEATDLSPAMYELNTWITNNFSTDEDRRLREIY